VTRVHGTAAPEHCATTGLGVIEEAVNGTISPLPENIQVFDRLPVCRKMHRKKFIFFYA
jgi:hypothetical protein